jgi:hypothetical protein
MDDALWGQSIIIQGHLQAMRGQRDGVSQDEQVLFQAIGKGAADGAAFDRPWDASTRSMRFASVIGDRLWGMYRRQQEQVCSLHFTL